MDTVQAVGSSIPYIHLHKIGPYFHALAQWCIDAGISMTALAATLTAGRNKDGKLLSERERDQYAVGLVASLEDSGFDLPQLITNHEALCVRGGIEWKDTFWRFITYRQPFVTKSGKFGLGPRGMNVGDSVVVLWSGQCPFVASETGHDQWILKGECFVKEWVNGDAVAALVREEEKEDVLFKFV